MSQQEAEALKTALSEVIVATNYARCEDIHHRKTDLHVPGDTCFPLQRLHGHVSVVRAFAERLEGEQ